MDTSQQQSSPNTNINVDCEVDMPGDTPVEVEPSEQTENLETQERGKKRRLTSDVWNHFEIVLIDGKDRAKCKYCHKDYVMGSHRYGTSTLTRHLSSCKVKPKYNDVSFMLIDHEGKLRAKKIDHNVVREMISMSIIEHDLPYSFVEYKRIRELHKYLNSDYKFISRNTAAADVYKFYEKEKEKLKNILKRIPSRICLTSDLWTACTVEGYICLTAHYIDNNWKLNSKILSFCAMPPPHTGIQLAKKLLECLKEWGIEKKLFSLTLDNASANDSMQNILKGQLCLQNDLLCNGEFFHVRCSAHILNLIVQDGLKVMGDALNKIRDSVKYVKGSEGRMKVFEECVETVGLQFKVGLSTDVPTRWNSTYKMLDSAIKYRRAFSSLHLLDTNYKHCPSKEEWARGEKICEFLMPFNEITKLISGSTYPTSNLYFMQVWKIELLLKRNLNNEDVVIRSMASNMKVKFEKYWEQYSVILAMGAVFDPRMKCKYLEFCFKKLDPNTYKQKLDYVKRKLYMLFEAYKSKSMTAAPSSSTLTTSCENARIEETSDELIDEFVEYCNQDDLDNGKSALDVYLDEPQKDMKMFDDGDGVEEIVPVPTEFSGVTFIA
nr:zinc finger BED domain-containing protein RICESLEEPER 2-like isoform X1 [Ipomoea trifida]